MASGFSKRNTAQGHISFGMQRVNYTLGIMHWAQDERRCSRTASLTGIADAEEYKALLGTTLDRATLINVEAYQADTISNAGNLVKFKEKRTWHEWEVKFENYLSIIPGVNDMHLSCAAQFQAAPNRTKYFQGNFIAETIACAPLRGAHFQADTRNVHQLLKNYLVAETAEQWISSIENSADGCDDFEALRRHYSDEGNVSRRVATVDCL